MGHYAILDSFEPIDRILAARGVEVEAKTYIPMFWLAMFEPGDVRTEPLTRPARSCSSSSRRIS